MRLINLGSVRNSSPSSPTAVRRGRRGIAVDVEEVWQAISPLIPAKSLSFYDWSTSELETFLQKAQGELEQRRQESSKD